MASFALLLVALLVLVISWLWDYAILRLIWRPYITANKLKEHGIHGPPYKFFKGCNENIKRMKEKADSSVLDVHDHNYLPRIAPHYLKWRHQYGIGSSPVFPSVLMMTKTMVTCAQNMVKELEDQASKNKNGETQVELDKQFQELTADIISHTAFGTSYKLGIEAFHAQKELQEIAVETLLNVQIPGSNFSLFLPMAMAFLVPLALVALLAAAITWLWDYTFMRLVWRPYAIGKDLRRQGIHGPTYKLVKGCKEDIKTMKEETDGLVLDVHDHNYLPRISPHYLKWRAQYGEPFLYWFGPKPRICIFDYELARQILSSKSGHFVKNDPPATLLDVLGNGLALLDGIDWVRHHRIIKPAFAMDKLKVPSY
nr:unnamed protein product [Digitaria exilis]